METMRLVALIAGIATGVARHAYADRPAVPPADTPVAAPAVPAATAPAPPVVPLASAPGPQLTLETTIELALTRNERSGIADANIAVADAGVIKARVAFLPVVNAAGTDTFKPFDKAPRNAAQATLTVTQPVIAPSAFPLYAQAKEQLAAELAQAADDKRRLAFDAAKAFFAVQLADSVVEAAKHKLDTAQNDLASTDAQFKAQLVSSNDVTRAQVVLAGAQRDLVSDQAQLDAAWIALAFVCNSEIPRSLASPTTLVALAKQPVAALNDLITHAHKLRPDLIAHVHTGLAAHDFAKEPRYRFFPTLAFQAQGIATTTAPATGHDFDAALTATAAWPIYDGGSREADEKSRDAQAVIADLDTVTLARQIEADIRTAAAQLAGAQAALVAANASADASRKSADETAILYHQGLAKAIELLDANDERFEAEVDAAGAVSDSGQRLSRAAPRARRRPAPDRRPLVQRTWKRMSCVVTVLLAACSHGSSTDPSGGGSGAKGKHGAGGGPGAGYPVDVAKLVSRKMQYSVDSPGSIEAFQQVQITARVAGAVDKVTFAEGQRSSRRYARDDRERALRRSRSTRRRHARQARSRPRSRRRLELARRKAGRQRRARPRRRRRDRAVHDRGRSGKGRRRVGATGAARRAAEPARRVGARADSRASCSRARCSGPVPQRRRGARRRSCSAIRCLCASRSREADAPRLKPGMVANLTLRESARTFTAKIIARRRGRRSDDAPGAGDRARSMTRTTSTGCGPARSARSTFRSATRAQGIVVPSLAVAAHGEGQRRLHVDDKNIAHQKRDDSACTRRRRRRDHAGRSRPATCWSCAASSRCPRGRPSRSRATIDAPTQGLRRAPRRSRASALAAPIRAATRAVAVNLTDICLRNPVLRVDADVRHDPLRHHRGHAHRRQPVPRRRQPDGHGQRQLDRRVAGGHRDRHHQSDRRRDVAGDRRPVTMTSSAKQGSRAHHGDVRHLSRDIDLALQDTQAKIAPDRSADCRPSAQAPVVSQEQPRRPADHHGRRIGAVLAPAARRRRALPGRGHARDHPRRRPGHR